MFALVAAIIWFLAALGVGIGSINMLIFGLAFLGLHFAFGWGLPLPSTWGQRQPPPQ